MADTILFLILVAILGGASWYVISQKKKGVKCIGCPSACLCETGTKQDVNKC